MIVMADTIVVGKSNRHAGGPPGPRPPNGESSTW